MMNTITFDTLELVTELRQKGFTEEQSEVIIKVIKKAQLELATKHDIDDLRRDIKDLSKDLTIRLGGITFLSFGLFSGLLACIVK